MVRVEQRIGQVRMVNGMNDKIAAADMEDLAIAVVKQAASDYAQAYRKMLQKPASPGCRKKVRQAERFFYSVMYDALTDVNPEYLLRKIRERIEHDPLVFSGHDSGGSPRDGTVRLDAVDSEECAG